MNLVGAKEHKELANEAIQKRQSQGGQDREQEESGISGHAGSQSAELADFEGVTALVNHADQEKQRSGRDAVSQHNVNGALQGHLIESKNAEGDEYHVANRGVSHESLEIGLDHGHERAVNDTDHRQDRDVVRCAVRSIREKGK